MPYTVELAPAAARALRDLPRQAQRRLGRLLDRLANESRPRGVKKLAGEPDLYRVRTGDYRIVYQVRDARLVVLVVRIGHRRDIYR